MVAAEDHLVAYMGEGFMGRDVHWLDIHHIDGSKGAALNRLKHELEIQKIICFGDSDNYLSMFALADEAYTPANGKPEVKKVATDVIGHHDEDGVAHFLRERFSL